MWSASMHNLSVAELVDLAAETLQLSLPVAMPSIQVMGPILTETRFWS